MSIATSNDNNYWYVAMIEKVKYFIQSFKSNKNLLSIFLQKVIFKRVKIEKIKNYLSTLIVSIYSIRE